MSNYVIVLESINQANDLVTELKSGTTPFSQFQLVRPSSTSRKAKTSEIEQPDKAEESERLNIEALEINQVKLLNPKLARQERQRYMAKWLMPFGFIAGLSFTQMTGLQTFSSFGLSSWSEPLIGSFLGMGSGLIGSYAAAASVNSDENDDLRSLRKLNEEGRWLLMVETPFGIEIPWQVIEKANPIESIRLREL